MNLGSVSLSICESLFYRLCSSLEHLFSLHEWHPFILSLPVDLGNVPNYVDLNPSYHCVFYLVSPLDWHMHLFVFLFRMLSLNNPGCGWVCRGIPQNKLALEF